MAMNLEAAEKIVANSAKLTEKIAGTQAKYATKEGFENLLNLASSTTNKAGFGDTMKAFGRNVAYGATKEGGGFFANYGKQMLTGAAINGGISGVTEWGQGGSFWEGAKSGMVSGAIYGGMYGATKAGVGMPGKSGSIFGTGSRVSKQVQAMFVNEESLATARGVMANAKK